ncbi:MAG: sugar ABC transporter permease [Firmicutes bacterium]|nr:sugar ABC transporter permease [Bacillota bacterium]
MIDYRVLDQKQRWRTEGEPLRTRMAKNWHAYVFLLPMIIWWVVFQIYPIIASYSIVLYDWSGVGTPSRYVGLENFSRVAMDPFFWKAFKNSFLYTLFQVPTQLFLALVLAIILNSKRLRGQAFFRTIFFLPNLMATSIVALVIGLMLNPFDGVVNQGLMALGLIQTPIHFLGDPKTAFPTIIVVGIWQTLGINMVFFLAGLQAIPNELFEASGMDGATGWDNLWKITLPLIKPVAILILLMAVLGSMNVFDLVLVLTNGGPYFQTEVVQTYIYKFAFVGGLGGGRTNVGFASAAALFMSVILLGLSALQITLVQRIRKQSREYGF